MIRIISSKLVEYICYFASRIKGRGLTSRLLRRGLMEMARIVGRGCVGVPIKTAYGVKLACHLEDKTNLFAATSAYGDSVADAVRSLKPGEAFVDIGANSGLFSIIASERVGPEGVVFCFEPQRNMFSILAQNIESNCVDNAVLFNAAVTTGSAWMYMNARDDHHTGIAHLDENGTQRVLGVSIVKSLGVIGELLEDRHITIKIDVEGAELDVVRSLRPLFSGKNVRRVIVEISNEHLARFGAAASELYTFMREQSFCPIVKDAPDDEHYDEIFYRSEVRDGAGVGP